MIPPIPELPPSYEQTIEAITACGVPASHIRISFEEELQSDVVTIEELDGTDEERLLCVRRAVHPFYIIEIGNEEQRRAFYAVSNGEDCQQLKTESIEWLRANEMLDRVPRYDPEQGLESFARSIEAACGLPFGSALEVLDEGALTFRRDFLQANLAAGAFDATACLMRMIDASNANEHDVRLGFIGNEALNEDER